MQMDTEEAAVPSSQDAGGKKVPEAPGTESKALSAEAEAPTGQALHGGSPHSNGGTSAEQEPKPALPAPQADTGDSELQRRKAALLQRVRISRPPPPPPPPPHACVGTCHTTVVQSTCLCTFEVHCLLCL